MRFVYLMLLVFIACSISNAQELPYSKIDAFQFGDVVAVTWHPQDSVLAVAGSTGIQLFDDQGNSITTLDNFDDAISAIAWTSDGATLAVAVKNMGITLWSYQASSFEFVKTIPTSGGIIESLAYNPNGGMVATFSRDETQYFSDGYFHSYRLRIYDTEEATLRFTSENPTRKQGGGRNLLQWSEDGEKLLAYDSTEGGQIIIYDTTTWTAINTTPVHREVMALTADPLLSSSVISGGDLYIYDDFRRHEVSVFNMANDQETTEYELRGWVTQLKRHPQQNLIASADTSGDVITWTSSANSTLTPLTTLRAHLTRVYLLDWDQSSSQLATVDDNNTILIWHDTATDYTPPENTPSQIIELPGKVDNFSWSRDGKHIIVIEENTLNFYDIVTKEISHTLELPVTPPLTGIQFTDTRLMVATYEALHVFEYNDEMVLAEIERIRPETPYRAALSHDGTLIAYSFGYYGGGFEVFSGQPQTHIRNIVTGEILELHTGYIQGLIWGPNDDMLLVGSQSGPSAHIRAINTDSEILGFGGIQPGCCGHGYSFQGLDWHDDYVVASGWGLVTITQLDNTKDTLAKSRSTEIWQTAQEVVFSADGSLIAGIDRSFGYSNIYIWETETARPIRLFVSGAGFEIAWSPEGHTLAALGYGEEQSQLLLWEIENVE